MLSRWFERGLGSIVAPDEKYMAEQPPAEEGMSSFWRMVAPPDPAYDEQMKAVSLSSPEAAAPSATPIKSATKTTSKLDGFTTPLEPYPHQQDSKGIYDEQLDQAVLTAARGFAKSMFSPPEVIDNNNKVFRLCASSKPLVGKLTQKLETSLVKDKDLLKVRAAHLGNLVPDGMTPLQAAAHAGNVGATKVILKVDNEENVHLDRDLQGRTALHIAAQEGNVEVAQVLKEKHENDSIPPDALVDLTGRTPFGTLLTSPNPKAKKNQSKMEEVLFSPTDISVFGSPPPSNARETVYRSLDMVYGQAEIPGYRVTMEDAICSESWHDEESGEFYCLLGVCDGHSDRGKVSTFVAEAITALLQSKTKGGLQKDMDWHKIWMDICLEVDQNLKVEGLAGGSTAVMALITKNDIIVANVGDSRCILVQRAHDKNNNTQTPETPPPPLADENASVPNENASNEASADDTDVATEGDKVASETQAGRENEEEEAGAETEEGDKAISPPKEPEKRCNFEVIALSEDHKPNLNHERERVEKAGLTVIAETFEEKGGQSVTISKVKKNSSNLMAVSRSFGDFEYKANKELAPEEQAIIAVPEVRVHSRAENDMFLVVGCDGVFDFMTNEDVAKFIVEQAESTNEQLNIRGRLPEIGDALLKECLDRGSRDNLTVAVGALSTMMEKFTVVAMKGRALDFSSPDKAEGPAASTP